MPLPDFPIHSDQFPRQSAQGGVRVREDTLHSDHRGKERKAIRKRAAKALEKLQEPLSKLLEPEEVVLYVARAQAPASWFEQLTLGGVIYRITGTMLVLTNRRLLHFLVTSNGAWKRSLRSVRWGDLTEAKVKGFLHRTLQLQYRNGKKETYWGLRRDDSKKIKVLLSAILPAATGEGSAVQGMASLCPNCRAPLEAGIYRCSQCFLVFKDETTMGRRSWVLPGGGYFYTGHPWLGIADFIAEAYLSIVVLIYFAVGAGLLADPLVEAGEEPVSGGAAWGAAAFVGILLAIEKWFTVHHCRRFIREFIPATRYSNRAEIRYWIALIVSGLLLGGMFIFSRLMEAKADQWASQGYELSSLERLLIGTATFIYRFWSLVIVPVVIVSCFGIATFIERRESHLENYKVE